MKMLFIMFTLIIMLQGCVGPQYRKLEDQSVVDVKKEEQRLLEEKKARESDDYLYYYVAHSFSRSDVAKEGQKEDSSGQPLGVQTEADGYGLPYSFNGEKSLILSEVVSKMADQLLFNYDSQFHNEAIALTSIVDLNNHQETNWLGQTISEQFIHELHIRKLRVVDYKLTGDIQVTNEGEFAMTRNWKKLNKNINVNLILTGTMSRNEEGVILNVRIVNATSGIVGSTSSAFIPHSMFAGGRYDYQHKQYLSRSSQRADDKGLVDLVR